MSRARSSLKDIVILVTRPAARAIPLCARIREAGGQPILLPTLIITPLKPAAPRALADAYIFISQHAVEYGLPLLQAKDIKQRHTKIFAVGQATARVLSDAGYANVQTPPEGESSSENLLAMTGLQAGKLRGRRVILVCGTGGRPLLTEELRARGAQIERLEVYRRNPAETDIAAALQVVGGRRPDATVMTSVESMENLARLIRAQGQEWLFTVPLVVMSERIATERQRHGFTAAAYIAPTVGDDGLITALHTYASIFNPAKKS
jgi:uroporphyrinogen-III synthase